MEIRVRGINKVTAKGKVYYYHRKTGTRINLPWGTSEFLAEVERLDATAVKRATAGTIGALIVAYRKSPEFTTLAPRTQKDYIRVCDWLRRASGELRLVDATTARVIKLRDRAYREHKRRFANYVVQVLSLLFAWGRPREFIESNTAAEVEKVRRGRDEPRRNRAWKDAEVAAVLAAARPEMRIAVALGAYVGLREGDMVRLPWSAYDGATIELRQGKTQDPLWLPVHRDLKAVLDGTKRRGTIIVVGKRGASYTESGFRANFFRLVRKLREAGEVGEGLTFHGLRTTAATNLADAGCDTRTIMAVTGHRTEAMVAEYTRGADQRRRARSAIVKLERRKNRFAKPQADKAAKPGS